MQQGGRRDRRTGGRVDVGVFGAEVAGKQGTRRWLAAPKLRCRRAKQKQTATSASGAAGAARNDNVRPASGMCWGPRLFRCSEHGRPCRCSDGAATAVAAWAAPTARVGPGPEDQTNNAMGAGVICSPSPIVPPPPSPAHPPICHGDAATRRRRALCHPRRHAVAPAVARAARRRGRAARRPQSPAVRSMLPSRCCVDPF